MKVYSIRTVRMAAAGAAAFLFISCSSKITQIDAQDMSQTPSQTIDDMFAVQTKNSKVVMRMEADVMQHFETDTLSTDFFPEGISVYSYSDDGRLESLIVADKARHLIPKRRRLGGEKWEAFGNVIIHNVIKQETMETDTIYWDQKKKEIFTDCYVRMFSPDGFMQGYGMRSDDKARNSILLRPFDSYGLTQKDTTEIVIDSVNFIGPFKENANN